MQLTDLRLQQFRSYQSAQFTFDPHITLITGKNGVGKTNLLEAIFVLLQGTSFRGGDTELLHTDTTWWRIDGKLAGADRQVRFQRDNRPAKQLVVTETAKRFTYKERLPLVLFEPTDLQLVHGSPARRRDTLDTMLVALSHPYKQALSRYERALQQRNNILKKQPSNLEDALFSWDVLLSEYGVQINSARHGLIAELNHLLPGHYSQIAGGIHELKISYKSELPENISTSQYIAGLHRKLPLDRLRGTTSLGPHRDDLVFILEHVDAKQSASRGEVRSLLLALKIAYAELLEKSHGTKPIILLDDVFSELDTDRQTNLLSVLGGYQTIITDTRTPKIIGKHIQL
ncbi:MAG: DNA replication and repair protein RecF [Candidatus Saccharimonadales bacterium]